MRNLELINPQHYNATFSIYHKDRNKPITTNNIENKAVVSHSISLSSDNIPFFSVKYGSPISKKIITQMKKCNQLKILNKNIKKLDLPMTKFYTEKKVLKEPKNKTRIKITKNSKPLNILYLSLPKEDANNNQFSFCMLKNKNVKENNTTTREHLNEIINKKQSVIKKSVRDKNQEIKDKKFFKNRFEKETENIIICKADSKKNFIIENKNSINNEEDFSSIHKKNGTFTNYYKSPLKSNKATQGCFIMSEKEKNKKTINQPTIHNIYFKFLVKNIILKVIFANQKNRNLSVDRVANLIEEEIKNLKNFLSIKDVNSNE